MIGLMRKLRRGVRSFLERPSRGLLIRLPEWLPGREALVERVGIRRTLQKFDAERPGVWKFGPKGYQWVTEFTPEEAYGLPLRKEQMHVADVVVVGPDGQFITVNNLFLPTGTAYEQDYFERRLAAELKRMEEKGEIEAIGLDATGYVRRSIMDFNLYTMTSV